MALPEQERLSLLEEYIGSLFGTLKLERAFSCWPLQYMHTDTLTAPRVALIAEAAHILHRMLWSSKRPKKVFRKLPFAPPPQVQGTDAQPVAEIMDWLVREADQVLADLGT